MSKKKALHLAFAILVVVTHLLFTGCIAAFETTRFDLSAGNVPSAVNGGDRYCVIRIDEERLATADMGQSPPSVEEAQSRLAAQYPRWFSSGEDSVPVVVKFQSSAFRNVDGGESLVSALWYPIHFCTLGLVPFSFPSSKVDFGTSLSCGPEKATEPVRYTATAKIAGGQKLTTNDATFPASRGWRRIDTKNLNGGVLSRARFDVNKDGLLDAFCASVALAVQGLTSEERQALRENNEAWWLDAKMGNKRNCPVTIVKTAPAPAMPAPVAANNGKPRIISQDWDSKTRDGTIVFRLEDRTARDDAMKWLRSEYLPEYCRTLGVVVSADDPTGISEADIRFDGIEELPDESVRLKFHIGN